MKENNFVFKQGDPEFLEKDPKKIEENKKRREEIKEVLLEAKLKKTEKLAMPKINNIELMLLKIPADIDKISLFEALKEVLKEISYKEDAEILVYLDMIKERYDLKSKEVYAYSKHIRDLKNTRKLVNMSKQEQLSQFTPEAQDIIINPEEDLEAEITLKILRRLNEDIYFMEETGLFLDLSIRNDDKERSLYDLETALTVSGIKFYKNGKSFKRINNFNGLIKRSVNYPIFNLQWERRVKKIITRPCFFEGRVITKAGFDEGILKIITPQTKDEDLNTLLNKYSFFSERSKTYALISMFAAFGAMHWKHLKPAFYFHALSQAGRDSGKTSLAKIVSFMRSDLLADFSISDSKKIDYDSIKKKLLTNLKSGAKVILLDNIPNKIKTFYWSDLDFWLTSETWNDRILGSSKSFCTTNDILYLFTGNNVLLSEDLMSRSAVIIFGDKFKNLGKEAMPDLKELGNNLCYKVAEYFEKWVEAGMPKGKPPEKITSLTKYYNFWLDIAGIFEVNGIQWGQADEYETSEYSNAVFEYDEILSVLSGKRGTSKSLFEENEKELLNIMETLNPRILARILVDLSRRFKNQVIKEKVKYHNSFVYRIENPENHVEEASDTLFDENEYIKEPEERD